MFEKTKAAATKAKEHLDAGEALAERQLFGQGYAHLVLALEESAVSGVRLLTESGVISWATPPPWFKWKEKDLSRPGTHRQLLRLGLTIATVRPALVALTPKSVPDNPREAFETIMNEAMGPVIQSIPQLLTDPVLLRFLKDGDRTKMAAFYSSPWKPAPVPDEDDYRLLHEFAQRLIPELQRELPTAAELATIFPLLQAMPELMVRGFDAKKTDLREALLRSLTGLG